MGILRVILAMAVIASHTRPFSLWITLPGGYAVETFFMISGFYIGLILDEKYFRTQQPFKLFITNRILRLYPLYFLTMCLSIGLYLACDLTNNPLSSYLHSPPWPTAYMILTNIFILGLDIPSFLPQITFPPAIVGPAWSLSLEFMFYCLAPFLMRMKTVELIGLMTVSLLLRLYLIAQGLYHPPWSFNFFPTELIFFISGLLAYKIYKRIRSQSIPSFFLIAIWVANILLILGWYSLFRALVPFWPWLKWPIAYPSYLIIYYTIIWISLPLIFHFTRERSWDRVIGEFSYPIYLLHGPIIFATGALGLPFLKTALFPWVTLLISGLVSAVFLYFVIYPIERHRQHRILSHKI